MPTTASLTWTLIPSKNSTLIPSKNSRKPKKNHPWRATTYAPKDARDPGKISLPNHSMRILKG